MSTRELRMLLSLSAADALGAATEFKSPGEIEREYGYVSAYQPGSVFGFAPGEATDDTQMTVATLQGYASGGGDEAILAAMRAWLSAGPPDAGVLTRHALRVGGLSGGAHAWANSGYHSAGNGGLMRIAACRVAGLRGERLLRGAAVVTALTHADPRCVLASALFVRLLEILEGGAAYEAAVQDALGWLPSFRAGALLQEAGVLPGDLRAAYDEREGAAANDVAGAVHRGLAGEAGNQSGFVIDTLQAVIAHARGADWLSCVLPAVNLGNDSDTAACITGALVAARGFEVPARLLPDLRLGHTWDGWQREWRCEEHYPELVERATRGVSASGPA